MPDPLRGGLPTQVGASETFPGEAFPAVGARQEEEQRQEGAQPAVA